MSDSQITLIEFKSLTTDAAVIEVDLSLFCGIDRDHNRIVNSSTVAGAFNRPNSAHFGVVSLLLGVVLRSGEGLCIDLQIK